MRLPPILQPLLTTLNPAGAAADVDDSRRKAAVLVLLFPRASEASFLLTARPNTLSRHPGQISLPGGAREPGDRDLWDTALRETGEELGVKTGRLRRLGRLELVWVAASDYAVTPFVAWNPVPPVIHPNPREVAEVIEVPVRALLDPMTLVEERWELRGSHWHVSFYQLGEARVWGATARMLGDLAQRVYPSLERPLIPGSVRPA